MKLRTAILRWVLAVATQAAKYRDRFVNNIFADKVPVFNPGWGGVNQKRMAAVPIGLFYMVSPLIAQNFKANYDESRIPPYTLPELLVCSDGARVTCAARWTDKRRPEILRLFAEQVYGKTPEQKIDVHAVTTDEAPALNGLAIRKQVTLTFRNNGRDLALNVLLYIPAGRKEPVPAFLGLNFKGNQSVHDDPGIHLNPDWIQIARPDKPGIKMHATEKPRGASASRWQVETVLRQGYAVVTAHYGDIDPDFDDNFQNGIHPLFYKAGQSKPAPDEWGSIGAWAWGLSRILDYLETEDAVDHRRVAVFGHSRLGKTALWAGAQDERFAMVISNDSGCGGAALSRRAIGETVGKINQSFPHWFCDNFKKYNLHEADLPVDQHMLLALIAPRPVYVASAQEDLWADPHGEFLSLKHAGPVYKLLGFPVLTSASMPEVNHPVHGRMNYHIRTGGHNVTAYDWEQYINCADRFIKESGKIHVQKHDRCGRPVQMSN